MKMSRRSVLTAMSWGAAGLLAPHGTSAAEPAAGEIRIGNTSPYLGPTSSYGTFGRCDAAYFAMVNAAGGINGRKVEFISYNGDTPAKTVEMVRKLVEGDDVLFLFHTFGTPHNAAVHRYLNDRKVPQLFVASGGSEWADPARFPWTMGFQPSYQSEARIYARYVREQHPNRRIAALYQNDDFGKDYFGTFKEALGPTAASLIVSEATYLPSDPTVDSQIIDFQASGADVFLDISFARFAAQAIRKAASLGWRPVHILVSAAASAGTTLQSAGFANAKGILSTFWLKDPTDLEWERDAAREEWLRFMAKWYPEGDKTDVLNVQAYTTCQAVVQVLKQCGDDLTRARVMQEAANLRGLALPMLLPGIVVNTGPANFRPIEQMQMGTFDGERWVRSGPLISASAHA